MTLTEQQLWDWHVKEYGEGVDVPATYRKLLEEVGELGEALMNGDEREAKMEAGDCAVLLLMILRGMGENSLALWMANVETKLETRSHAKLMRNQKRKDEHR